MSVPCLAPRADRWLKVGRLVWRLAALRDSASQRLSDCCSLLVTLFLSPAVLLQCNGLSRPAGYVQHFGSHVIEVADGLRVRVCVCACVRREVACGDHGRPLCGSSGICECGFVPPDARIVREAFGQDVGHGACQRLGTAEPLPPLHEEMGCLDDTACVFRTPKITPKNRIPKKQ
eukprot:1515925-Amphidinium_carterae.1